MKLAILQARLTSRRFPGKVLKDINGEPMIIRQLNRVRNSKLLEQIIVATSINSSDDELVGVLEKHNIKYFRGDLDDVASRFVAIINELSPSMVIRLTADCPLIDPNIIDLVIQKHLESGAEYTSNTLNPTFPDGLDVECFDPKILLKLYGENPTSIECEHVTYGLYTRTNFCKKYSVEQIVDYSKLRWTVDIPDDLEFVKNIFENFSGSVDTFSQEDVLKFLDENPNLHRTEASLKRNSGLEQGGN
jgi:spore coat polysaccharide biosynthesis protein SpsF